MSSTSKVCTKCGIEKDLEEFYTSKIIKSGRVSRCKVCITAQVSERQAKPEIKERIKIYKAEYHEKNKERDNAKSAARRATPEYKIWIKEYRRKYRETRNHVLVNYRQGMMHKYHTHKQGAKRRSISFEFTFEQWLYVWEESGHLDEMGTHRGQYCMARHNDEGVYAVNNVTIKLSTDNVSEGHTFRKLKK